MFPFAIGSQVLGGKHRWNEMLFHDVPCLFLRDAVQALCTSLGNQSDEGGMSRPESAEQVHHWFWFPGLPSPPCCLARASLQRHNRLKNRVRLKQPECKKKPSLPRAVNPCQVAAVQPPKKKTQVHHAFPNAVGTLSQRGRFHGWEKVHDAAAEVLHRGLWKPNGDEEPCA